MNNKDDEMTLEQWILAIVAGVAIGLFAPAWVVFALFFGTRGNR